MGQQTWQRVRAAGCALAVLHLLASCGSVTSSLRPPPDIYPDDPKRASISKVYVFGDSISDTGNMFGIIDRLTPVLSPRLQSQPARPGGQAFSNKYLGVEYIAAHYGVDLAPAWEPTEGSVKKFAGVNAMSRARIARHMTRFRNPKSGIKLNPDEHKATRFVDLQHSGGNNYAVANAAIQSYPGLKYRFFNRFRLSKQISLYANRPDRLKTSSDALHFVLIGGNDIFNLLNNPAIHDRPDDHIALIVDEIETQVQRLRDMGARKILVGTAPNIGNIPAFHDTSLQETATRLSLMLDRSAGARVRERFDPQHVRYVSVPSLLNQATKSWPTPDTNVNCVMEKFELGHFLISDGEVSLKFRNGCNEHLLEEGDFVFFDPWHGTDALYQKIGRLYIQEINAFMRAS